MSKSSGGVVTQPNAWHPSVKAQVGKIEETFAAAGQPIKSVPDSYGGVDYMCSPDEILVHQADISAVRDTLTVDHVAPPEPTLVIKGVLRQTLAGTNFDVDTALQAIDARRGRIAAA